MYVHWGSTVIVVLMLSICEVSIQPVYVLIAHLARIMVTVTPQLTLVVSFVFFSFFPHFLAVQYGGTFYMDS